jgi:hypothetical protein
VEISPLKCSHTAPASNPSRYSRLRLLCDLVLVAARDSVARAELLSGSYHTLVLDEERGVLLVTVLINVDLEGREGLGVVVVDEIEGGGIDGTDVGVVGPMAALNHAPLEVFELVGKGHATKVMLASVRESR